MLKKAMFKDIKTLVWDWNGTLINDVEYAISCMNALLKKRNLPLLSLNQYKSIFAFPVIEYYKKVGFDFSTEPWEKVGYEFMKHYWENFDKVSLYSEVNSVLKSFSTLGYKQVVLSAMEQDKLEEHVKIHGLPHFFDRIQGIDHHYADGKVGAGEQLINMLNEDPKSLCMIGDTTHDFEVAEALGMPCVLIAQGHSTKARLSAVCANVVEDLSELKGLFLR